MAQRWKLDLTLWGDFQQCFLLLVVDRLVTVILVWVCWRSFQSWNVSRARESRDPSPHCQSYNRSESRFICNPLMRTALCGFPGDCTLRPRPLPPPISKKVRTRCGSPPRKWFLVGRSSALVRVTEQTPHSASRLVHAMRAWSVKIRRAPSRRCRRARVCGHFETPATHDVSTARFPPAAPFWRPLATSDDD